MSSGSRSRILACRGVLLGSLGLMSVGACRPGAVPHSPRPSSSDVVSVGYGERSRDQVGGAVQSVVLVNDSTPAHATRVEEFLRRFPGVHVQRTPSGGYSVRIGGSSTFMGNQQPLFVVEGVAVHVTPERGLDWLSPADVARIDILRGPAETSIYGARGANGVIVITTRRPR